MSDTELLHRIQQALDRIERSLSAMNERLRRLELRAGTVDDSGRRRQKAEDMLDET